MTNLAPGSMRRLSQLLERFGAAEETRAERTGRNLAQWPSDPPGAAEAAVGPSHEAGFSRGGPPEVL